MVHSSNRLANFNSQLLLVQAAIINFFLLKKKPLKKRNKIQNNVNHKAENFLA